jgi:hypothetical protein
MRALGLTASPSASAVPPALSSGAALKPVALARLPAHSARASVAFGAEQHHRCSFPAPPRTAPPRGAVKAMASGHNGASPAAADGRVTVGVSELRELCCKALKTLGYAEEEIPTLVDVSRGRANRCPGCNWAAVQLGRGLSPLHMHTRGHARMACVMPCLNTAPGRKVAPGGAGPRTPEHTHPCINVGGVGGQWGVSGGGHAWGPCAGIRQGDPCTCVSNRVCACMCVPCK